MSIGASLKEIKLLVLEGAELESHTYGNCGFLAYQASNAARQHSMAMKKHWANKHRLVEFLSEIIQQKVVEKIAFEQSERPLKLTKFENIDAARVWFIKQQYFEKVGFCT